MNEGLSFIGLPFSVLKRTPTIQQVVRWGYVQPSTESNREETRIAHRPAAPDLRRPGVCLMCGNRGMVNTDGHCRMCWSKMFTFLPPEMEPGFDAVAEKKKLALLTYHDIGAMLGRRYDEALAGWGIGVDYHPPARLPAARSRPWRRHWYERSRTAPERLFRGVWLRCLVCLRVPTTLRRDQVCEACEKDWRRKGKPRGIEYEHWLIDRRVRQWDKSPERLATYDSARFIQVVRTTFSENMPLTRYDTKASFKIGYNRSIGVDDSERRLHG